MVQNALSRSGSNQPSTAKTPLSKIRRLLPIFTPAALLALALWLALVKVSPAYANIRPPYTADFTATQDIFLQQFGFAVASAGDVNHDGFGDVVVGAPTGLNDSIYIYKGSSTGLITPALYSDAGTGGDSLGWSVDGGKDATNDHVDDFVAGAPETSSSKGAAYLYAGSGIGLPTKVATLTGEVANDQFGWAVAMVGDVNHDGKNDIAVGAPGHNNSTGRVYVYYGPISNGMAPALTLDGENPFEFFGKSVAAAGDVNGDGIDDFIAGAPQNDEGGPDAGKAYLFYGANSGPSQGNFTPVTGSANDKWGTSVHGAGDVNGDGFADVIVGSDTQNPIGTNLGRASVYPGGPAGLIATPLFTRPGEFDDDQYGFAVAGNGDLDGDGFSDFAIGAYLFDAHQPITGTDEGKAYGYAGCGDGALHPSLVFSNTGEIPNASYGHALAIVNDVNGDGLADLVVGSDLMTSTLLLAPVGKIYAYYGAKGGCRPELQLNQLVTLADYPDIYTNTTAITVPTDAAIRYDYIVRNSGNVTLTQQNVVDDKWGSVMETAYTLAPDANISVNISETPGLVAAPGVNVSNVATWTGAISISSPSGVTLPGHRLLSAFAVASTQVTISGPTLDQDHDGVIDNQEGSGDSNHNHMPAYLDASEIVTGTDPGGQGPDPDPGSGNPPPSGPTPDTAIDGLAISAPITGYINSPVLFAANISAGTNVTYTWDFGDGQSATLNAAAIQAGTNQVVSHTFTKLGNFVVHATATNSVGQQTTQASIIIRFQLRLPDVVTFGFAQAP